MIVCLTNVDPEIRSHYGPSRRTRDAERASETIRQSVEFSGQHGRPGRDLETDEGRITQLVLRGTGGRSAAPADS